MMEIQLFQNPSGAMKAPSPKRPRSATRRASTASKAPSPSEPVEREAFIATLAESSLDLIAEVCTATPPGFYVPAPGATPADHLRSLREGIERSLPASPRFINTMAGSDAWTFSRESRFSTTPSLRSRPNTA
jgi:hypothetical protein